MPQKPLHDRYQNGSLRGSRWDDRVNNGNDQCKANTGYGAWQCHPRLGQEVYDRVNDITIRKNDGNSLCKTDDEDNEGHIDTIFRF